LLHEGGGVDPFIAARGSWQRRHELRPRAVVALKMWAQQSGGGRGPKAVGAGGHRVTPYFLKRREAYKFIDLNKYLIVAFHVDAYFPLCCEVFLYFIV
jgi:hypothetical protein